MQNQGRWSVNVWCGTIIGGTIIGPFIIDEFLNGEVYLNILQNELPILLGHVPLNIRRDMFSQHDGCPAHFTLRVREFLDEIYSGKWIGYGRLFSWPPWSADLTYLNFYLWERLKDMVYTTQSTTIEDMIQRIQNAIGSISVVEIETSVLGT